jgi:hypothetical protein
MCLKHHTRVIRHGDPHFVGVTGSIAGPDHPSFVGEDVGYSAAHTRVRKKRGDAYNHLCVDCSEPAKQWAYDHSCVSEKYSDQGPYSANTEHYQPMCVPCHKRFDLDFLMDQRAAV